MSHVLSRAASMSWQPTESFETGLWSDLASRSLALILLIIAAPVILGTMLMIWLLDGGPVLYRGERLGEGKTLFTIYKLRTLKHGAQKLLGSQLMSNSHDLLIPLGGLLRRSRLDELPQLFNIVRGDMRFLGPRPERPEIYLSRCRQLSNYEQRFLVPPGLIGYSQLFTPHNTPKRFRAMLDNRMLKHPPTVWQEVALVSYTILCVGRTALGCFWEKGFELIRSRVFGQENRRSARRVQVPEGTVTLLGGSSSSTAELLDLNESTFRMRTRSPVEANAGSRFQIRVRTAARGRISRHSAVCSGEVSAVRNGGTTYDYVVRYEPLNDSALYTIHQYILGTSMAIPARLRHRSS